MAELKGFYMGNGVGQGHYNTQHVIEDFMKTDYEEGFRNEFNTMEALINKLPKKPITGKKLYKSFKLGLGADTIRAVGSGNFDQYALEVADLEGRGADTVEAEFDTTKLMATFKITDEAILKGTGDGSLIDVLRDGLNDMEVGMRHTYNRYIYGSRSGLIGKLANGKTVEKVTPPSADTNKDVERDNRGKYHNTWKTSPNMVKFEFTNSHSLIQGMGCMVKIETADSKSKLVGYIFQKDNTQIHKEVVYMIVDAYYTYSSNNGGAFTEADFGDFTNVTAGTNVTVSVFSRQLDETKAAVNPEYTGLEDIVCTQNTTIFGVDRNFYKSLNCTAVDLESSKYLNEEILRDLSDHLALTSPDGTSVTLCAANHRIISQIEKQMYQYKNYNSTSTMGGTQLGGAGEIKFDTYVLYKDKFARNNNLYMLDQTKIGELVRRDFTWITSGEKEGVLQRRPGTEIYEGIMNKYADMYIDAWRCHAVIKNCKVVDPGTFFSYQTDGQAKSI